MCMKMSPLVIDYASNQQLSKFVEVILLEQNDGHSSIWSQYLKNQHHDLSYWEEKEFVNCVSRKLGVEAEQRLRKQDVA